MKTFWVRWKEMALQTFEYHGPWWISGYTFDDNVIICAVVMAPDDDVARFVIDQAHDSKDGRTVAEWSFIEKPDGWTPWGKVGGRFQRAPWMKWPWPALDKAE